MDIVVVGATGNIGTCLLDALAADADVTRVRACARRAPQRSWPKTTFVQVDIVDGELDPVFEGADAVVHLAWIFQPTHRPDVTWRVNVGGSVRVFDAAVRQGVGTIVYSSSVGAYSPVPSPDRSQAVDERWPTDSVPTAAYGREKAYVERVLDGVEARQPQMRVVRLRPGFVFQRASGTQQRRLFAGPFVPASLLHPGTLPVLPFPEGLRFQGVHAKDLAQAFHLALSNPTARGAFNVAADPVLDATRIATILGTRAVAVPPGAVRAALALAWHARLAPADPALFDLALGLPLMRTDRARSELGWTPTVAADDALAEALAGMAEGAGAATAPLSADSPRARLAELVGAVAQRRAHSSQHGSSQHGSSQHGSSQHGSSQHDDASRR